MTQERRPCRRGVRRAAGGGSSGPGWPGGASTSARMSLRTRACTFFRSRGRGNVWPHFFSGPPMPEIDLRMSVSAVMFFIWK